MKRSIQPVLFHAILAFLTWYGFHQGVAGAANIVTFLLWLALVPIGILAMVGVCIGDVAIKAAAKPPFPRWAAFITRCTRWFCLLLLVWHGAWATAIGMAVFMASMAIAWQAIKDARKKLNAQGATA